MKTFVYITALALMLLTACGSAPTATLENIVPSPLPSNTLEPTSTPPPTDTATPVPTATLDVAATVAAEATKSASAVLTKLEDVFADSPEVPYKDGRLVWQQADPVIITLTGPSDTKNTLAEIPDTPTTGDFIFKSDVTWTASGWIVCGVVFRSEANINNGLQYQFQFLRFSGLPAFVIEIDDDGKPAGTLGDLQFSSVIDLGNGAVNELILVAQGDRFTAYFNGQRAGSFVDFKNRRIDGTFAFMSWQDSGQGSCKYENSWVWSLDK